MIEFEKPEDKIVKIKIVGVGGGGNSAVNRMIKSGVDGVDFIAINTDLQALRGSSAEEKLQIGEETTRGLGAGANPEVGKKSALESRDAIYQVLNGADMVFITAGMGGGTGTGAAPVVAQIAKEAGILTVAVVSKPFDFEGPRRKKFAEEGIEELKKHVDSIIVIPNQNILKVIDKEVTVIEAFNLADEILKQGIHSITTTLTNTGLINVDFADIKTIMSSQGDAYMGIGRSSTSGKKAEEATMMAINSKLLEMSIKGAESILVTVASGSEFSMTDFDRINSIILKEISPDAQAIHGVIIDETLKNEVVVTVIAAGFDETKLQKSKQVVQPVTESIQKFETEDDDDFIIPDFIRGK